MHPLRASIKFCGIARGVLNNICVAAGDPPHIVSVRKDTKYGLLTTEIGISLLPTFFVDKINLDHPEGLVYKVLFQKGSSDHSPFPKDGGVVSLFTFDISFSRRGN